MLTTVLAVPVTLSIFATATAATAERGVGPLPAPLDVRIEHFSNPAGITEPNPMFSYRLPSLGLGLRGVRQTAYRVAVTNVDTAATVWDSKKTASNTTNGIVYAGKRLVVGEEYSVSVWWFAGQHASASATGTFGMAPASDDEWGGAAWIGNADQKQHHYGFTIPAGETVRRATAFIDAPGCAVVYANGRNVNGLAGICPWTQFPRTVLFSAHNMTEFLVPGDNALGFQLGQSMYYSRGGGEPRLRLMMIVVFASGRKQVHITKGMAPLPPPPPTPPPPAPTECGEAAEHGAIEMSCPGGQTIAAVDFAAFGTPTGACAGGKATNNANDFKADPACNASAAYTIVAGLCLSQPRCAFHPNCQTGTCHLAGQDAFPDPCRMVHKHLTIAISCSGPDVGADAGVASAPHVIAPASAHGTGGWLAAQGPVVSDDPWHGTTTNWSIVSADQAAKWATAAFDPSWSPQAWAPPLAQATSVGGVHRISMAPPTRELRTIAPTSATDVGNRTCLVAFPINFVGVVVFDGSRVASSAPGSIELVHSEVLAQGGKAVDPDWSWGNRDTHLFGSGDDIPATFRPSFTWHGFQYVAVTASGGVTVECTPAAFSGSMVGTVLERTGHVHFGNDTDDGVMLNQLQGIVLQGQVSNVVQGIPTDCPTREKHGWLGDAASTAEEAMFNFEMQGVFEEFLQTIRDNQDPAGDVPGVVPATSVPPPAWGAGRPEYAAGRESFTIISPVTAGEQWTRDAKTDISWSAAYPLITAWLLKHYNNLRVVERHWPSLVEYMDGLLEAASNQTECGGPCLPTFFKWGDWCAVEARSTATPSTGPILAGFNYIAALDAMVEMGRALGNEGNATRYQNLASSFRAVFHSRYYNETTGTYGRDPLEVQSLTTAPLALGGTIPEHLYAKVVSGLVANIAAEGNHQTVGSVGAKYLLTQLAGAGQQKTAMLVATQKTYPSFGYWMAQGATTCWENYSGKPDPSHPPPPTHNHIFLCGGLGEWLYRNVAGISPASNGYQHVTIFPDIVADAGPRRASSSVNTVGGRVEASWQRVAGGGIEVRANLPAAVQSATIVFRAASDAAAQVTEGDALVWSSAGGFAAGAVPGIVSAMWTPEQGGLAQVYVGPGSYSLQFMVLH